MAHTIVSASQKKWDLRYRAQPPLPPAAEVLTRYQHVLPFHGKGLDVACGLGANSLFLARRGLQMEAWDISPVALQSLAARASQSGLHIDTQWADLESHCVPKARHYNLIVVSRYLHRPLCQTLAHALADGGLLFYQTFTATQNAPRDKASTKQNFPQTQSYKLQANELLQLFASLETVHYHEDTGGGEGDANMAYYVGRRPGKKR